MRADPGGAGTRAGRRRYSRKDRRQCSRPHPANATKKEGAGAGEGVRKAEEGCAVVRSRKTHGFHVWGTRSGLVRAGTSVKERPGMWSVAGGTSRGQWELGGGLVTLIFAQWN